ncbi:helix-turn-helix domain-containing protein [Paenibacillus sp. GCM10012307]|uniref:Transposase n=1 Tax=Paenibacillus roseus TaxID=2798579 RepID=A0A934J4D7_9BACL|nr:helix-turn-helix domain-containing protein [Paenibacillus roseus]MBJ6362640.1 transposase [Paenibacillus roseus]
MSHRSKISEYEKIEAIEKFLRGEDSLNHLASLLGVTFPTIKQWLQTYQSLGPEGLQHTSKNRAYSADLKKAAVEDYLIGAGSHMEICRRYGIKSTRQLRQWILKYNGHSSLNTYSGGSPAMTKGRSTTWQERIDIVLYCHAHEHDYKKAAEQFKVSYQQVYGWMKKYEAGGQEALQDGRGRKKAPEELSEADHRKLEMKKLEYENERLRAENAFLKKLQELERGRR